MFLQLLRFLSNELRLAFVGVGVPEAPNALLSDSQLRSRFTDIELPPWSLGDDLRDFVTRLTWSLPAAQPVAGQFAQAAVPAGGADRWHHAGDLQSIRTGCGRGDPRWAGEAGPGQLRGAGHMRGVASPSRRARGQAHGVMAGELV